MSQLTQLKLKERNPNILSFSVDGGSVIAVGGSIVESVKIPDGIGALFIEQISVLSRNGSSTDFDFELYDQASGTALTTVAASGLVYQNIDNNGRILDRFTNPMPYRDLSKTAGSHFIHYNVINTAGNSSRFDTKITFTVAENISGALSGVGIL